MLSFLIRIFVTCLLIASANAVLAQRLKSIPIDGDFVTTALGPRGVVNGHQTYAFLGMHKIVNVEGKMWACGALFTPLGLRKEFIQQAKIIASDGTRIKKGLTRFSEIHNTNADQKIINNGGKFDRDPMARATRADANQFRGQPAKCLRSRKKWRESFGDGMSILQIPPRVMVRIPG